MIEYDGEQHFKPVKMWGGEEGLQKRKRYDKIKTDYAQENNIKLIRISFYDKNNIIQILNQMVTGIQE